MDKWDIDHLNGQNQLQHVSCPILNMGINGVLMIFGLVSWLILVSQCVMNSYMMFWQLFQLKPSMIHMVPHHDTAWQWTVNNIWSCLLGNQGCAQINELITKLLTSFIAKNTTYNKKNTVSNIINIAVVKMFKKRLLAVEYLLLVIYHYPTGKTRW
jgi:hypothetical protein